MPGEISRTLSIMTPGDLWPSWRCVDLLERHGEMDSAEARRWKVGIYRLMQRWGLEPDDLVLP